MERYGVPEHLRSENGPEFIAYAIQDWLEQKQVKALYIKPGSPWDLKTERIRRAVGNLKSSANRVATHNTTNTGYNPVAFIVKSG